MKRTVIHIILLLHPLVLFAGKDTVEYTGGLDTTIDNVVTAGLWQHNKDYGRWRLISKKLGWEHTRSYLYLQWLKSDDLKRELLELQTTPINEFNDTDWRNLIRIEYKNKAFIFHYRARGNEAIKTGKIIPGLPGKYEVKL
jgi:hypothetical protein